MNLGLFWIITSDRWVYIFDYNNMDQDNRTLKIDAHPERFEKKFFGIEQRLQPDAVYTAVALYWDPFSFYLFANAFQNSKCLIFQTDFFGKP